MAFITRRLPHRTHTYTPLGQPPHPPIHTLDPPRPSPHQALYGDRIYLLCSSAYSLCWVCAGSTHLEFQDQRRVKVNVSKWHCTEVTADGNDQHQQHHPTRVDRHLVETAEETLSHLMCRSCKENTHGPRTRRGRDSRILDAHRDYALVLLRTDLALVGARGVPGT